MQPAAPHPAVISSSPARPRLRIHLNLDRKPIRKSRRRLRIKRLGNAMVRLGDYRSGRMRYWMLFYYENGKRIRESRSDEQLFNARVDEVLIRLNNHESAENYFSREERQRLRVIDQTAAPTGVDPLLVIAEGVELRKLLAGRCSPVEAIRTFLQQNPADVIARTVPQIVEEFSAKRIVSSKWKRVQEPMLERFASHFTAPITSLTSRDLDDWLDGLRDKKGTRLSLRTRRNYRDLVLAVVNFAKSRGYLPREWRVIDDVSDPKLPPVDVHLYTPDELVWLLNIAESHRIGKKKIRFPYQKLVPFIVTTAFAGVRHGEMNEDKVRLLDWSDYDWTAKGIYIGKHTAKTGADRVVDMTDNLIAWLEPYRRKTGRICSLANTSNALCELRKIAAREALQLAGRVGNFEQSSKLREIAKGLSGPKKNALRKSFISYKKALTRDIDAVADQAGNSTGVIRKTYLRSGTRMAVDAERWFSIMPQRADVLPLFTWGGQNVS